MNTSMDMDMNMEMGDERIAQRTERAPRGRGAINGRRDMSIVTGAYSKLRLAATSANLKRPNPPAASMRGARPET